MAHLFGYLFAKLGHIGSKSEGPVYFLQQWEEGSMPVKQRDTPVEKNSPAWKQDPTLHPFLGQRVVIEGDLLQDQSGNGGFIRFRTIESWWGKPMVYAGEEAKGPHLTLQLSEDPVWVNRMPPVSPNASKTIGLSLAVSWLGDFIWQGTSPTSQLLDFLVLQEDREIWRWSPPAEPANGPVLVMFLPGEERKYQVAWTFQCLEIQPGSYIASATFHASGQTVTTNFEVKAAL